MNKPTRYYSKKQEDKVAKSLGGRRQSNSGATPFYKGDVVTKNFLIECKTSTTEKKSVSIKKEWLTKNQQERFAMNKPYSAIAFDFGEGDGEMTNYIIDERLFKRLLEVLDNE